MFYSLVTVNFYLINLSYVNYLLFIAFFAHKNKEKAAEAACSMHFFQLDNRALTQ